jgi:hypothetical protein
MASVLSLGAALATVALLATSADARPLGEVTITAGRSHGVSWTLRAGGFPDGSYCVAVTVAGSEAGRSCGNIRDHGIQYMALAPRASTEFVVGPVLARARSVRIRFFERPSIRLRTIAPPPSFVQGIRFFAAVVPCPATPRSLTARDAGGRIVARTVPRSRRPPPVLAC